MKFGSEGSKVLVIRIVSCIPVCSVKAMLYLGDKNKYFIFIFLER